MNKFFLLLLLIGSATISFGQIPSQKEIDDYATGLTKDLNQYIGNYMDPFLRGAGYGLNSGWYNTAKPHESFGVDLMMGGSVVFVPSAERNFIFNPEAHEVLDLENPNDNVLPTILGEKTDAMLQAYLDKENNNSPYIEIDALGGIKENLGGYAVVPIPLIQLGVGIVKGTDLKIRWFPNVEQKSGVGYKYLGVGGMHSISQWIPRVKELEFLNISGLVGFSKMQVSYDGLVGDIIGGGTADKVLKMDVNAMTYELIASASISALTGYIGVGIDHSTTNLITKGDYNIKIPGTDTGNGEVEVVLENPIELHVKNRSAKITLGARLKIALFTVHAAYTVKEYNTLNVGVGFSFL